MLPALHTNLMDRMRCLAHWPARSLPAPEHVQSGILGDVRSRNWLGRGDLGPPLAFKISSSGTLSKIIWSSHCLQRSQAGAGGVLARLEGSPPAATAKAHGTSPLRRADLVRRQDEDVLATITNSSSSLGSPLPLQSPHPLWWCSPESRDDCHRFLSVSLPAIPPRRDSHHPPGTWADLCLL